MNILILGGTRYIGVHLVYSLLKKGHNITIATRGITKDEFDQKVNRICFKKRKSLLFGSNFLSSPSMGEL